MMRYGRTCVSNIRIRWWRIVLALTVTSSVGCDIKCMHQLDRPFTCIRIKIVVVGLVLASDQVIMQMVIFTIRDKQSCELLLTGFTALFLQLIQRNLALSDSFNVT